MDFDLQAHSTTGDRDDKQSANSPTGMGFLDRHAAQAMAHDTNIEHPFPFETRNQIRGDFMNAITMSLHPEYVRERRRELARDWWHARDAMFATRRDILKTGNYEIAYAFRMIVRGIEADYWELRA